jgi:equilibrative nucleoside transporter 1/2/3
MPLLTVSVSRLQTSPSPRIRWSLYLLHITSLLMLFPVLPILLPRLSPSSPLLLPLLLLMTTSLACSTAYLQSAVFALAALWGSDETLAVMSGQGGIAVLVSFAQVILAVLGAMRRSAPQSGTNASVQSTLAGVGLWAISAVGAAGCIYAHTVLKAHVEYPNVLAPVIARGAESARAGGMGAPGGDVKQGVTGRVFRKNKELEMAVAWVFVVTLVRPFWPWCRSGFRPTLGISSY